MKRKSNTQLELPLRKRGRGGKRPGAGRPRRDPSARACVSHHGRPTMDTRHPVHITLRMLPHVWNLRTKRCFKVLDRAMWKGCALGGFRLVHHSVQGNHVHLIAEAQSSGELSRGMQGLAIRMARGLNKVMGRKGRVFADRYHMHILRTPRETRAALGYVFCNWRHHRYKSMPLSSATAIDPFSSAGFFDGWSRGVEHGSPPAPEHRLSAPRTWLLAVGWRRAGLLDPAVVP
jgi:REP element-mobilizing transposase RayT